jgi:hypothetical protein
MYGRYTIVYFIQQKETNYRQLLVTYVPDTNEQSPSHYVCYSPGSSLNNTLRKVSVYLL